MIHAVILALVILVVAQQREPGKSGDGQTSIDPPQYVGTEACKGCHEEIGTGFGKNPHARTPAKRQGPQWQGCEACHDPGRSQPGAGDPANVIAIDQLSRGAIAE